MEKQTKKEEGEEEFYRSWPRNRNRNSNRGYVGFGSGILGIKEPGAWFPATYTMWCVMSANVESYSVGTAKV